MRLPVCALVAILLLVVPAPAQPEPLARPAATDGLGKLLRDVGHPPKALSPDVFQITIERERWPVHVMASLSTDGRRVWLESKFAPVEDPDKVSPAAWKRLLEANEKIGPAHFAFDKSDKRVHLYKSFDYQDLTAERLKGEIEHFDTTVRKTQEYWRGENFKAVETAAAPPTSTPPSVVASRPPARDDGESEKLVGDWQITAIQVNGQKTPDNVLEGRKPGMTIRRVADRITADLRIASDRTRTVTVGLDAAATTPRIDLIDDQNRVEQGIYKLDGDTLTLCFAPVGQPRPAAFADSSNRVIVFQKR
jgi:uncharacterized protein (TIGR03067 family)